MLRHGGYRLIGRLKTYWAFHWSADVGSVMRLVRYGAQVGQVHGGLMGVIQRSMVRSCPHVWFERTEMKDRNTVTTR